ncbi:MAG: SMP-30/gluconolactonase/LRE family protein [Chloroflexota bacterium]
MIKTFDAHQATTTVHLLAEGPAWDRRRESVWWVDIDAGEVLRGTIRSGAIDVVHRVALGTTVGAVVPSSDGGQLVAAGHELMRVAPDGTVASLVPVIEHEPGRRLNDGKCDPAGRFLVGSLTLNKTSSAEVLVRLERDRTLTVIDSDLSLSNGLGWSPDGRTMYSVDSGPGVVWRRPYEPDGMAVGARREAFRIRDGLPDGMCIDVEGSLWVAVWGAGEVRRYGPAGDMQARVRVPAPNVTSASFVGSDLDQLLITTASIGLAPRDLERMPASGCLFLADVGVRGRPVAAWTETTS